MSLLQRRILTIILFFVLLILGPLLISYGAGYRINLKEKRIDRVGLLHVTTEPDETTMVLDGENYSINKEFVKTGLLPKTYDIAISKEGYYTWFKQLPIYPNQTTFIRDLQLFRDAEASEIYKAPESSELIGLLDSFAIYQDRDTLQIFDEKAKEQFRFTLPTEFGVVFPQQIDTNTILFAQNTKWYLAKLNQEELIPLTITPPEAVLDASFSVPYLYLSTREGIYRAKPEESAELEQILKEQMITDIHTDGEKVWYLKTEPSQNTLSLSLYSNNNQAPLILMTIAYRPNTSIVQNSGDFLTIYSKDKTLTLVDANTYPSSSVQYDSVSDWDWSKNETELLIASDFELFILHFGKDQKQELILRQSSPITQAIWENEEEHVFYVSENKLHLIERDERDQRNQFLLEELETPIFLSHTTTDNKTLQFYGPDKKVIYEREIR